MVALKNQKCKKKLTEAVIGYDADLKSAY